MQNFSPCSHRINRSPRDDDADVDIFWPSRFQSTKAWTLPTPWAASWICMSPYLKPPQFCCRWDIASPVVSSLSANNKSFPIFGFVVPCGSTPTKRGSQFSGSTWCGKVGWVRRIFVLTAASNLFSDNRDGVTSHLKPDILQYEVKWALGSIITNIASRGDGIQAELFHIRKYDAVKVLHWICQQI